MRLAQVRHQSLHDLIRSLKRTYFSQRGRQLQSVSMGQVPKLLLCSFAPGAPQLEVGLPKLPLKVGNRSGEASPRIRANLRTGCHPLLHHFSERNLGVRNPH